MSDPLSEGPPSRPAGVPGPGGGPDEKGGRGPSPGRRAVSCPFCGSSETELMSLFGSSSLTSQYHCRKCRSAFEQVRWGTPPLS